MFRLWKIFIAIFLVIFSSIAVSEVSQVENMRVRWSDDKMRIVFDMSDAVSHKMDVLKNPHRVFIDFKNTRLSTKLVQPGKDHPIIKRIRTGKQKNNGLRVVFDLKQNMEANSFFAQPDKSKGNRVVLDLGKLKTTVTKKANKKVNVAPAVASTTRPKVKKALKKQAAPIVIAIDAGHGGEDPGAIGKHGTKEKHVALQISKKLAKLIDQEPGMKAVLTRKGDYFIPLRKRMEIARKNKADLFISIHADSFKNARAKGASVYTLSNKGATSEAARLLAHRENASDLVGGTSLADKDKDVANLILDLTQNATKEYSSMVANKILPNLKKVSKLHSRKVQKAGFVVLKSPEIPSVLIETAFISNPSGEKNLRSRAHQQKLAKAIFKGTKAFFAENSLRDKFYVQKSEKSTQQRKNNVKKHVIARGDTLSEIAVLYGVSMKSLKSINSLRGSKIRIGQVLQIPTG